MKESNRKIYLQHNIWTQHLDMKKAPSINFKKVDNMTKKRVNCLYMQISTEYNQMFINIEKIIHLISNQENANEKNNEITFSTALGKKTCQV